VRGQQDARQRLRLCSPQRRAHRRNGNASWHGSSSSLSIQSFARSAKLRLRPAPYDSSFTLLMAHDHGICVTRHPSARPHQEQLRLHPTGSCPLFRIPTGLPPAADSSRSPTSLRPNWSGSRGAAVTSSRLFPTSPCTFLRPTIPSAVCASCAPGAGVPLLVALLLLAVPGLPPHAAGRAGAAAAPTGMPLERRRGDRVAAGAEPIRERG